MGLIVDDTTKLKKWGWLNQAKIGFTLKIPHFELPLFSQWNLEGYKPTHSGSSGQHLAERGGIQAIEYTGHQLIDYKEVDIPGIDQTTQFAIRTSLTEPQGTCKARRERDCSPVGDVLIDFTATYFSKNRKVKPTFTLFGKYWEPESLFPNGCHQMAKSKFHWECSAQFRKSLCVVSSEDVYALNVDLGTLPLGRFLFSIKKAPVGNLGELQVSEEYTLEGNTRGIFSSDKNVPPSPLNIRVLEKGDNMRQLEGEVGFSYPFATTIKPFAILRSFAGKGLPEIRQDLSISGGKGYFQMVFDAVFSRGRIELYVYLTDNQQTLVWFSLPQAELTSSVESLCAEKNEAAGASSDETSL